MPSYCPSCNRIIEGKPYDHEIALIFDMVPWQNDRPIKVVKTTCRDGQLFLKQRKEIDAREHHVNRSE